MEEEGWKGERGRKEATGRTFSARSSSASFPVPSTRTRAPKILILSVSMAMNARVGYRISGLVAGVEEKEKRGTNRCWRS